MRRAVALVLLLTSTAALAPHSPAAAETRNLAKKEGRKLDWDKRMRSAERYARGRTGSVSFAAVDERGRAHGSGVNRSYSSASLVKAMILVAFLRRGDIRERALHDGETALLGPMIRSSDNDAADTVYAQVGPSGLARLARRARMKRFEANEAWGGSQVTARDQAEFFARIERLLPERHRGYALGLLRDISQGQRWGIPQGAPKGWRVHFKGGWFPSGSAWRVHQGALLTRGKRELSVAVLTEGGPSLEYGAATIAGVTRQLLRRYPEN